MKPQRIALYGEMQNDIENTSRFISSYYDLKGIQAEVIQFSNGDDFMGSFRGNCFDTVFLEINSVKNLDIAWIIRNRDKKCSLVIMSDSGDYSLQGYRLEAAGYILKPLDEQTVHKTLDRLGKRNQKGVYESTPQSE